MRKGVPMSSVTVENHSNRPIAVAVAYNHFNGNLIAQGWFDIAVNQSQTLSAPDASDMYLRVQDVNTGEITFSNFTNALFWTIIEDRFTISKEPDDANVQVLQWGGSLEHQTNKTLAEPFPAGWANQRFFQVGLGNHIERVNP
jgi:uncharacterized membrane protein